MRELRVDADRFAHACGIVVLAPRLDDSDAVYPVVPLILSREQFELGQHRLRSVECEHIRTLHPPGCAACLKVIQRLEMAVNHRTQHAGNTEYQNFHQYLTPMRALYLFSTAHISGPQ